MALIFPGLSCASGDEGASRTEYLTGLSRRLPGPGGELSEDARETIDSFLLIDGREPGPLRWRRYIERACGGSEQVLKLLGDTYHVLDRLARIGVESRTADDLQRVADGLNTHLTDVPPNAEARFRWILNDMIERIETGLSDSDFGNFNCRIDEAGCLALLLGYESVPVQRTRYDRDGENTLQPWMGHVWPEPMGWLGLKQDRPEYAYLFGYRLHEPVERSFPLDLTLCAMCNSDPEFKLRIEDTLKDKPKAEAKAAICTMLRRWMRELDGRRIAAGAGSLLDGKTDRGAPVEWAAPPGYVGTKAICNEPRFRKDNHRIPRTTIDVWLGSHATERIHAPDSNELHVPEAWVHARIAEWHPRRRKRT